MKRIGIISDTHGVFDAPLEEFLADVDEIWHAGDIGSIELSDRIAAFKPLRAVYGNIDDGAMHRVWPSADCFRCEDVLVLMTHIGGFSWRYEARVLLFIGKFHPHFLGAGASHFF